MENNKISAEEYFRELLKDLMSRYEQYFIQIEAEISTLNPENKVDKEKFEKFKMEIIRLIFIYKLLTPGTSILGPTETRRRLEDILRAFTKPEFRSPIHYLKEIAGPPWAFLIKSPYDQLFYDGEVKTEEWLKPIKEAAKEASAALGHIENLIDIIQNELSIHKNRGRGKRLNRQQLLDRAVVEIYCSFFGKPRSKSHMTGLKLIVREIVGEPSTDIRKSMK